MLRTTFILLLLTGIVLADDFPAFHKGGPLLGVAGPIGAPPMRLRWQFRSEDDPPPAKPGAPPSIITPGYEASAVIAGGVVYAADRAGMLRAIDLKTGKKKWAYHSEPGFSATPAIVNGVVYLGDEDGMFHAVKADTGHKFWTFEAGSTIHAPANFVGDRIIFGDDGADIYCLSLDGKKLWEAKSGDRVNGAPAIGVAIPGQSPSAFVSGCDAQLRAIDVETGKERYAKELGALCPGSPALLPDRIVIGTDGGKVVCMSPDGEKKLWEFEGVQNGAMVYSSPAVADGVAVVGTRDRNVYGLELATGKKLWAFSTRGEVDSSPVIAGGRVYVGSKDKRLYVIDLKTGKEIWSFTASRGITASPAVADGALVIGDSAGVLYCLEPGK
jgi:outer membrane protein assembly factor BamB